MDSLPKLIKVFYRQERIGAVDPLYWEAASLLGLDDLWGWEEGAIVLNPELSFEARSRYVALLATHLRGLGMLPFWRGEVQALVLDNHTAIAVAERALFRIFSWQSHSVYACVWSQRDGALGMWLGQRSPDKAVSPNAWDVTVNGGVIGLESPWMALQREGWEEANLNIKRPLLPEPPPSRFLGMCWPWARGIQRKKAYIYDIYVSAGWRPVNQDGEVLGFSWVAWYDLARLLPHLEMIRDAKKVVADVLRASGPEELALLHVELEDEQV